jgi:hypothetical protein
MMMNKYLAACGAFFVIFFMWCMHYVALQLEQPFGTDANDLPMYQMQKDWNKSVGTLLTRRAQTPPEFTFQPERHRRLDIQMSDGSNPEKNRRMTLPAGAYLTVREVTQYTNYTRDSRISADRMTTMSGAPVVNCQSTSSGLPVTKSSDISVLEPIPPGDSNDTISSPQPSSESRFRSQGSQDSNSQTEGKSTLGTAGFAPDRPAALPSAAPKAEGEERSTARSEQQVYTDGRRVSSQQQFDSKRLGALREAPGERESDSAGGPKRLQAQAGASARSSKVIAPGSQSSVPLQVKTEPIYASDPPIDPPSKEATFELRENATVKMRQNPHGMISASTGCISGI